MTSCWKYELIVSSFIWVFELFGYWLLYAVLFFFMVFVLAGTWAWVLVFRLKNGYCRRPQPVVAPKKINKFSNEEPPHLKCLIMIYLLLKLPLGGLSLSRRVLRFSFATVVFLFPVSATWAMFPKTQVPILYCWHSVWFVLYFYYSVLFKKQSLYLVRNHCIFVFWIEVGLCHPFQLGLQLSKLRLFRSCNTTVNVSAAQVSTGLTHCFFDIVKSSS